MDDSTGTHYFHWLLDVYKPLDFEPVQVYFQKTSSPIVVSRFHWFVLTVWLDPVIAEGKPVIRFIKGFHTPISYSKAYIHFGELNYLTGIEELWFYRFLLPFLKNEVSKSISVGDGDLRGYKDKIVLKKPPKQYMFDISACKCYVIVSKKPPTPEGLPDSIKLLLWP